MLIGKQTEAMNLYGQSVVFPNVTDEEIRLFVDQMSSNQGDNSKLSVLIEKLKEGKQNSCFLLMLLAQTSYDMQLYDNSLSYCKLAELIDPTYINLYNQMAKTYESLGQFEDAISCYENAINANEQDTGLWTDMGFCFQRMGEISKAKDCFQKALAIDENYVPAIDAISRLG